MRPDVQALFADLQKQIVFRNKTNDAKTLTKSATAQAQLAKAFGLPVTVSVVPQGGTESELLSELEKETKGAPQFNRMSPNPFLHPETKSTLAANGRKTLVIAGCAMEAVVLHSVTGAIENGYRVLVAIDACGGISERSNVGAYDCYCIGTGFQVGAGTENVWRGAAVAEGLRRRSRLNVYRLMV